MKLSKKRFCLVLNRNWVPLRVVTAKDAIMYLLDEGAKALDPQLNEDGSYSYDQMYTFDEWIDAHNETDKRTTVSSQKHYILIPEIIVLATSHMPDQTKRRGFSKRKVFIRDGYKCGYCLEDVTPKTRTIDHVIPQSKGGKTTYDNVVCACTKCNSRKDDKSLKELGWILQHRLVDPTTDVLYHVPRRKRLKSWDTFIK